jgi:DNA-binding response OmpR family regulator
MDAPRARTDVALLRWPTEAARRDQLARDRSPRLLLLSRRSRPPVAVDELEDWMREPLDPVELRARVRTLQERVGARSPTPWVDAVSRVHRGNRRIDLPPAQHAVARVTVEHFGRVVPPDAITAAMHGVGASAHPKAVVALIARLRVRFDELGLELRNVRGRGYVLSDRDTCATAHRCSVSDDRRRLSAPSARRAPLDIRP